MKPLYAGRRFTIMDNLPVFDTSDEYRTWKALNGKISEKNLDAISTKVLTSHGFIHHAILTSLMDALNEAHGRVTSDTLKTLVSKSRPQDCSPAIRATEILVKQKDITSAAEIMSQCGSKDTFRLMVAQAEMYHGEGDKVNSVQCASKALDIDPNDERLYQILKEDDPSGPWADMQSVNIARTGKEATTPSDERYKELYLIYKNWYRGNKDSATNRLVNSEHYKNGDWEFMLVSARTSVDEGDWRSAKMVFRKLPNDIPIYAKLEMAEAFIAGHEPEEALNIYDELDMVTLRVLQGRIFAYAHMGADKDLINAIYDYLDNEQLGAQDYADMVDMLISRGSMEDVKAIQDKMSNSNKNDPYYLISRSKYMLERGDIRGASRTAMKATLFAKDDPTVRVLSARMRFINNDVKGSEKECDKLLTENPEYLDALVLKRDILVKKNDVKGALDICRRILEISPNDVRTMFTLATAQSGTGDMNGAMMTLRNVLRLEPSRENVLNVVGSMIEEGMYREAMFLCYDLERDIAPDPMIRRLRGNAEYAMGEYMKASVSFAAAAELAPNDPVIWHSKGMADEARGDLDSAEASYNRAVNLDLNEPQYWISKASVQEKFNNPIGAVDSLNRAIELDPYSLYPMIRKAVILERAGRYTEAIHLVDLCSESEPDNPQVSLMKARLLRETGSTVKASTIAKGIYDSYKTEDAALEAASCFLLIHDRSQALDIVSEALTKYPDSQRLKAAMESIQGGSSEIVEEEKKEAGTSEDPEAIRTIAESMYSMGEYKGALRHIDRALALSGDDLSYLCLKSRILVKLGEVSNAQNLISDALKDNPKSGILHEALGDIKLSRSDFRGALNEYEKALSLGLNLPEILAKKGDAQQGLGYYDRSIDSYAMAVARNREDLDLHFTLAQKLYDKGYMSRADKEAREILEQFPEDGRTMILLARISKDSRKDMGITDAYKMFKASNIKDTAQIREMVEVLNSAGHDEEAKSLMRDEPEQPGDIRIKRAAEKVLRRAYVSRADPADDDLLMSLGYEGAEMEELKKYLSKEAPYGDIVPGSPEFQRMERLSNEIIMKIGWKDLEERPKLPLDKVFVTGFKDVEEAKRLVSYINRAMTVKVIRDESLKMVMDRVQGSSVYDIMKSCKVGVYQARQIQLLSGVQ